MKRSFLSFFLTLSLWTVSVYSDFTITSTTPAEGTTGVATSTTLSFTFSEALDTAANLSEVTVGNEDIEIPVIWLEMEISIEAVQYSEDLKTISFQLSLDADKDYCFAVSGAKSLSGKSLAEPFMLNFTTYAGYGTNSVSGKVNFGDVSPKNSFVILFDNSTFGEEEEGQQVLGTIVSNSEGTYVINSVRDGTYWPVAAKDVDGDGEIDPFTGDILTIYDSDGDSNQDSIVIAGNSLNDIDMEILKTAEPTTVKQSLETANALALSAASDNELKMVAIPEGNRVALDGKSNTWLYAFYSATGKTVTTVMMMPFMIMNETVPIDQSEFSEDILSSMASIPDNMIDSDSAMKISETNGGRDFRTMYQVENVEIYGADFSIVFPQYETLLAWMVTYHGMDANNNEMTLILQIDMVTGELIQPMVEVKEDEIVKKRKFSLYRNYPNPFNPETNIKFHLDENSFVTLKIYDITGREIETLVDDRMAPGEHQVTFHARGLPSGIYFYCLQVDGLRATRRLLLLR